ncbi:type IV pilus modification protein PilV [Acinetobacter bohemicus]|uniref:type IV pilus modification protein PilV n=1 Tax=Acinetobacter TaxID=469 RepID=UPI00209B927B|nr:MULTISPECIES: type IV pilus modification protein PilV [Acinetobacter]MCO8041196.1 type IV pilus modification protein PilV [Acinetobacter sp. S4400-12]MCU7223364.1 type IV pilus modification protein PilV [Acinetobacter bohemicus]
MNTINNQRGMGLVEVLVALFVLAIGVLGFIALQYRAVEATEESSARIQAINLGRDLAERMRVNRGAENVYTYHLNTGGKQIDRAKNCFTATNCTSADFADFDVSEISKKARTVGMTVNYLPCQGNKDERHCIYVAWGDTAATDGPLGEGNCTSSTAYDPTSTCLIMEVY